MIRLLLVLAIIWAALMPPLFTGGACTAEYEEASALITGSDSQEAMKTPDSALKFLQSRGIDAQVLTPDDCARGKPRWIQQCSRSTLVWADVQVRNRICRIYRDDKTRLQLRFDRRDHLVGVLSEMNPFKYLPLPWGGSIDWAK